MADIDLNIAPYNSGTGWTPIGTQNNPFRGHFNGNYRKVSGLYINVSSSYLGLFGNINNGSVRNLGVEGSSVTGVAYVGGMAGNIIGGSITNCYTSVSVRTTNSAASNVGGVVGSLQNGSVINCYATGSVSGNYSVGGIVGNVQTSSITNCYAIGAVSGTSSHTGGVAGWFYSNLMRYCVGLNPSITRQSGSISTFGRVIGNFYGGTADNNVGWAGMTLPSGNASNHNGSNITTEAAKEQFSYEVMQWKFGFNDDNPWKMGVGEYELPVFYWQTVAPAAMPAHLK